MRRTASGFDDLNAAMAWAVQLLDGEWSDRTPDSVEFSYVVLARSMDGEEAISYWVAVVCASMPLHQVT